MSKHFLITYFVTHFYSNETSGCAVMFYPSKQRS